MGFVNYISGLGVVAIAIICALHSLKPDAILTYVPLLFKQEILPELEVAKSWNKLITNPVSPFSRVAVGVNGNVDLIVRGTTLLKLLDPNSNSSNLQHIDHSTLANIKDLMETFGYFHEKGAGGERYMNNYKDFQHILKTAKSIKDAQYFIGGNAVLMAQKLTSMVAENGKVFIGCPVGPILKPLLHSQMQVTSSSLVDQDEYHLIMEYSKGEKWNGRIAPIASRFIFSHDIINSKMLSLEGLIESLPAFQPDLLVLSGFHLLESQESVYRSKRLNEIANLLRPLSENMPIHLELASMSDKIFVKELAEKIFPLVDSIGLNEQELWLICHIGNGPHCTSIATEGPPLVSHASDIGSWMLNKFGRSTTSRLSRIHFHTLTYHISFTFTDSRWRNQLSAVLAGTRIAANQACDDDANLHPEKFDLRLSGRVQLTALSGIEKKSEPSVELHPNVPVLSWNRNGIILNMSPVLVCRIPIKTVGLGDAISATGLLYSDFGNV